MIMMWSDDPIADWNRYVEDMEKEAGEDEYQS